MQPKLFWQRLPICAFLSFVGLASLLISGCASSSVSPSPQPSHQKIAAHPTVSPQATISKATISSEADIVFAVDNVNQIALYDPAGVRFIAAQMLVDQAPAGDHIGVVRVTSSDKPSPVKLLDLTATQTESERNTIKQVLTQSFFGSVDRGPTAYFIPALQAASQMLLSARDNNRKYLIILTDSVAESGDQTSCPAVSDQYHQWFCELSRLEADKISVILYAFTTPQNEGEFQSTKQNLEQFGVTVLQVG